MTALASGLLWPLLDDEGTMRWLFVRELPSLEAWPQWAKKAVVWRTRRSGE